MEYRKLADLNKARKELANKGVNTKKLKNRINSRTGFRVEYPCGNAEMVTDYGLLQLANNY